MALPSTGSISMSQVRTELGASGAISLGQASVRTLAGVASGAISMNNLRGKANAFAFTVSANTQNLNVRTAALAAGWNGTSAVTCTIGTGVYIWSDSVATAALDTGGAFAGGLTIVNNGFIMGKGGNGGKAQQSAANTVGTAGGPAINLTLSCTINNTNTSAYIGGGGGGGGSCANATAAAGGGGAGGGVGGLQQGLTGNIAGGGGGTIGGIGGNGAYNSYNGVSSGGGGGRAFPGVGGERTTAKIVVVGSYGGGGSANNVGKTLSGTASTSTSGLDAGAGGYAGGGASNMCNVNPKSGVRTVVSGGGGGGWGAAGGSGAFIGTLTGVNPLAGGAGGRAVQLNGNSVSWVSGNTTRVWGSVS